MLDFKSFNLLWFLAFDYDAILNPVCFSFWFWKINKDWKRSEWISLDELKWHSGVLHRLLHLHSICKCILWYRVWSGSEVRHLRLYIEFWADLLNKCRVISESKLALKAWASPKHDSYLLHTQFVLCTILYA